MRVLLDFFANFSLALLIKVLLIKKACMELLAKQLLTVSAKSLILDIYLTGSKICF